MQNLPSFESILKDYKARKKKRTELDGARNFSRRIFCRKNNRDKLIATAKNQEIPLTLESPPNAPQPQFPKKGR